MGAVCRAEISLNTTWLAAQGQVSGAGRSGRISRRNETTGNNYVRAKKSLRKEYTALA